MTDQDEDLEKKISNPPLSASPSKKVDMEEVSSSVLKASNVIEKKEKELEDLAEKKSQLIEVINKKVEEIKRLINQAVSLMQAGDYFEAGRVIREALQVDPTNEEAKKLLEECETNIREKGLKPSSASEGNQVPLESKDKENPPRTDGEQLEDLLPEGELEKILSTGESEKVTFGDLSLTQEQKAALGLTDEDTGGVSAEAEGKEESKGHSEKVRVEDLTPDDPGRLMSEEELSKLLNSEQTSGQEEDSPGANQEKSGPDLSSVPAEVKESGSAEVASVEIKTEKPAKDPSSSGTVKGEQELEAVLAEVDKMDSRALAESERIGDTIAAQSVVPPPVTMPLTSPATQKASQEMPSPVSGQKTAEELPGGKTVVLTQPPGGEPSSQFKWKGLAFAGFITGVAGLFLFLFILQAQRRQTPAYILKAREKLEKGEMLLQEEKYREAGQLLMSIPDEYPSVETLLKAMMKAADIMYQALEDQDKPSDELHKKVVELYAKVIEHFPKNEETQIAYYRAASSLVHLRLYGKAEGYYREIVKNYPDSEYYEEACFQRARMLILQDKFSQGRECFLQIIKEFPNTKAAKFASLEIARSYQRESEKIKKDMDRKRE
ncbi:MAG: tetratricopeptide repeat protein [Candidatus Aureabacteria bacterium]|nr:tetratricopeptide repeat protein [Candidatus Auribacterota bacterium]